MKEKIFFSALMLLSLSVMLPAQGSAGKQTKFWSNMCASCHDGKTAPDAEQLRKRYKTTDEFVSAVKGKGARCMNLVKRDEGIMRQIAKEIGIKDK